MSTAHELENPGVRTTNGAGPHNIQLFFMTADGTVLQCMPGYWGPEDLALIINELVLPMNKIWGNRNMPLKKKKRLFSEAQLAFMNKHSASFARRSRMQNFDVAFEIKKRLSTTDCVHRDKDGQPIKVEARRKKKDNKRSRQRYKMKNTLEIALSRMAQRPFLSYESFDVAKFSDYGRKKYDKKGDGGGEERMGKVKQRKKKKKRRRKGEVSE